MDVADFIGWIGNIFFVWGVYDLGNKKIRGFFLNIIGNLLYLLQGMMMGLDSLTILSMLLIFLNIKGILHWRKCNAYKKNK